MFRKFVAVIMISLIAQVGCYNTYNLNMDELGKLTEGGSNAAVKVKTEEGQEIVVTENTKIGITLKSGSYRAISPFNFTMTSGQLIAPDEDLLEVRQNIATGNVKQVSGTKTALVVLTGLAAVVGGALYVTLSAEEDQGFGQ
ncbi:MAG: hypothetical protein ACON3Z_17040 [Bradymonadia bacterium]